MPSWAKPSTTRLPQSLLEEIDDSTANDHPRKKWSSKPQLSRKEARKQDRVGRKQRKAEFFSAVPTSTKRHAQDEHADSPKRKKAKLEPAVLSTNDSRTSSINKRNPPAKSSQPIPLAREAKAKKLKPSTQPKTALEKLVRGSNPILKSSPRSQKEKDEDAYIAYLESKLGYAEGSKRMKGSEDDGLDDLMDLASSLVTSHQQEQVGESNESDDESDLEPTDDIDGTSVYEHQEEDPAAEEWHGINESVDDIDDLVSLHQTKPASVPDENTAVATRYIPPHLRNTQVDDGKDSEVTIRLTRQLKGLLNRMSEQNMATVLESIEEVYRGHRRNDVTSTLTTLIIGGISSHSSLLDSYVVLYAAFVSSLHKIVGTEFAAYFVQNVVSSYERYYTALQNGTSIEEDTNMTQAEKETQGKECSNLIVLLSELYNFQVISCVLVFDIIRGLLDDNISEFNVELLLKIVRNSGQQLRVDDPSALKDIIQIVQNKLSDHDDALSSRTRFMVETLTNLKNNKLKRNTTQNQGGEAVERMKKFLSGLSKKRHVLAHEPLRVSLEDLRSAESKGKWWLVGAAWGGDPLLDRQEGITGTNQKESSEDLSNNALLKLARKHGMNTDIRRSIFVVLMSSDDYVDACERLSQLNLTEVQQREIIRVILHCCGNEKSYNPYYTLVCQHLCRTSHSYRVTLQFCLWDFMRDLGETNVGGAEVIKNLKDDGEGVGFEVKIISTTRMKNVAKAYAWWIAKDCAALGILKPVDFTVLKVQTREFLRELFVQLFTSSQVSTPMISPNPKNIPTTRNRGAIEEIFIKATRIQSLSMGIVYFMSEELQDYGSGEDGMSKLTRWAVGVAKDTLRTGMDVVPPL